MPHKIPLRDARGIAAYTLVDAEDMDLNAHMWQIARTRGPYAKRSGVKGLDGRRPSLFMHRVIAARAGLIPSGHVVDHINGDKLDNRRCNLRVVTAKQNSLNVGRRRDNSTGFKGVTFYKHIQKWCARIRVNKASKFLGTFTSATAAHEAYKTASKLYHGVYGRLE